MRWAKLFATDCKTHFWPQCSHFTAPENTAAFKGYKMATLARNGLISLHKKCPYSELFWSAFSRNWTEYGEIQSISLYSVWMQENADQNNSEYRHFSSSVSQSTSYNNNNKKNIKMKNIHMGYISKQWRSKNHAGITSITWSNSV